MLKRTLNEGLKLPRFEFNQKLYYNNKIKMFISFKLFEYFKYKPKKLIINIISP